MEVAANPESILILGGSSLLLGGEKAGASHCGAETGEKGKNQATGSRRQNGGGKLGYNKLPPITYMCIVSVLPAETWLWISDSPSRM